MRMTHSDKLERMQKHLAGLGISPSTAAPPIWRLLWRLGIELPPPLFMGFWPAAFFMGSFFGVFWGVVMWLLMWGRSGLPLAFAALLALVAGVLFGLLMAAVLRSQARNKQIPAWKDFVP